MTEMSLFLETLQPNFHTINDINEACHVTFVTWSSLSHLESLIIGFATPDAAKARSFATSFGQALCH